MPVLKSYTSRSGRYIHASVHGKVVTLQLTSPGFELLSGAGVRPGDRFGLQVLADLTRRGDAYTLRSGAGFHDAEQFEFAFDAEEKACFGYGRASAKLHGLLCRWAKGIFANGKES